MKYVLVLAFVVAGCSEESDGEPSKSDVSVTADASAGDVSVTPDTGDEADSAVPDGALPDAALPDAAPLEPNLCDDMGLPRRPFKEGSGFAFGDIAGDFTVNTLQGSYSMSEEWTGCESFVFLVHFPSEGGEAVWNSDIAPLMERKPPNTRYFFVSLDADPAARQARMEAMESKVGRLPGPFPKGVHFVTDELREIEGSVGAWARDYLRYAADPMSRVSLGDRGQAPPPPPLAFGIDRLQRWDSGGSLAEVVGRPDIWKMAGFLGPFYDHIARMHDLAQDDGATVVPLIEDRVTDRTLLSTVDLPDLTEFDTLLFDVSVTCPHRNVFACSEWDRIANIQLCSDEECSESREILRWITPYWRRGERRWRIDASPFIGELGDMATFRVAMGPDWERATERDAKISVRLLNQGQPRAQRAELAFTGGDFGAEYNNRDPFMFTPPPGTSRVELVAIISGHGQTMGDNCAEWCDHRHAFTINDEALPVMAHQGDVGSSDGCGDLARAGVSPGQFGNWAPERAFWCPGLPVEPIRVDITEWVDLGGPNELTYRATLGADVEPRGGNIALSAYVVSYRD